MRSLAHFLATSVKEDAQGVQHKTSVRGDEIGHEQKAVVGGAQEVRRNGVPAKPMRPVALGVADGQEGTGTTNGSLETLKEGLIKKGWH